jgi:hypothetical protein
MIVIVALLLLRASVELRPMRRRNPVAAAAVVVRIVRQSGGNGK